MPVAYYAIKNTTSTIPAPAAYSITGTVTVDANNSNNLQYTGTSPLDHFGTPPNTGTVEPVIINGEAGVGPQNCGQGTTGYTYLFIASFAPLVKVLGISLTASPVNGVGNYIYTIYTDTDCTGINAADFQLVFAKLVGYSGYVEAGNCTANGNAYSTAEFFNEAQLAPSENRAGGTLPPVLVVASSGQVNVIANS